MFPASLPYATGVVLFFLCLAVAWVVLAIPVAICIGKAMKWARGSE
jgi:hypothetical protein